MAAAALIGMQAGPTLAATPGDSSTSATSSTTAPASPDPSTTGPSSPDPSSTSPLGTPDLTLIKPPGSGEDTTLPLGTGVIGDFEAILTNSGADAPAATLTITLPAGLTVNEDFGVYRDDDYQDPESDEGGDQLDCTTVTATTVTCALGDVTTAANTLLDIPVEPTATAVIGDTGTFTVSALADSGLDSNPDDNSVSASVVYAGIAHLKVDLTATSTKVAVGSTTGVTVTVDNEGPQPAPAAIGIIGLDTDHFTFDGFTGKLLPIDDAPPASAAAAPAVALAKLHGTSAASVNSVATASDDSIPLLAWDIGTIDSGKSASAVATLKAVSLGTTHLLVGAISAAGDPACDEGGGSTGIPAVAAPSCDDEAFLTLHAIKAAPISSSPTTSPTTGASTTSGAAAAAGSGTSVTGIADTGAPVQQLGYYALLATSIGALLLLLGSVTYRRRPAPRHR
ncbi:hypothetical protein [Jatrophihabitans sp.]|uniref:hypothetical protein n=1 Tax=Jatrophihabitans sp. TaxID=1932789 RepID=UPI0030C7161C|nr:hypothetical protein [Jatrophihabitans sp.]